MRLDFETGCCLETDIPPVPGRESASSGTGLPVDLPVLGQNLGRLTGPGGVSPSECPRSLSCAVLPG